jgi:hypothetical protein
MRSIIFYTLLNIILGEHVSEEQMGGVCSMKAKHNLEDPAIHDKMGFGKDVRMWIVPG